jgi:NADH dehydrogenase (ubiquinone) 1 alpha/beta subcomplex 1
MNNTTTTIAAATIRSLYTLTRRRPVTITTIQSSLSSSPSLNMQRLAHYRFLRQYTTTMNRIVIPSTSAAYSASAAMIVTASAFTTYNTQHNTNNTSSSQPHHALHTSSTLTSESHGAPRHGSFLDRKYIEKKLLHIIGNVEKIDKNKLSVKSTYAELGLDSLDEVELNIAIEDEFVVDIEDHKAVEIDSIPKMVEYLANHPFAM